MEKVKAKTKELKREGKKYTSRVGKKRPERAGGIRVNKNRISSRFNSFLRDPIPTERAGGIRAKMNRINSRFNSCSRDPISTITVKLRASALKETT